MRGTGQKRVLRSLFGRVIPAVAGNRGRPATHGRPVSGHPRGCGEQLRILDRRCAVVGSSPRVRGTVRLCPDLLELGRVIPAGAGNSRVHSRRLPRDAGHPRGCGEQAVKWCAVKIPRGSSPRVRGTVRTAVHIRAGLRVIPAGAGNRAPAPCPATAPAGHPRGCGEQITRPALLRDGRGSSPRVRGTEPLVKLNPRMNRVIPAGAGNSRNRTFPRPRCTGHPRGCGEQSIISRSVGPSVGSSPRVRGTVPQVRQASRRGRVIPAGAGNRTSGQRRSGPATGHPRGCGEQSIFSKTPRWISGSSPRVRGTGKGRTSLVGDQRVIPAGAGNRPILPLPMIGLAGHPRGCGEQMSRVTLHRLS